MAIGRRATRDALPYSPTPRLFCLTMPVCRLDFWSFGAASDFCERDRFAVAAQAFFY
jgi:hypothetical protein